MTRSREAGEVRAERPRESRKVEVALYLASLSAVIGRFCCRRFGGESRRGLEELAEASAGIPAEVAGRNGTRSE